MIRDYGLIAIFAGCFFEGETVAITGGILANKGLLVLSHVVLVVIAGAFAADVGWFLLARRVRASSLVMSVLKRPGINKLFARVERQPRRLTVICRFIPGMRIIGPMVLAQSRIPTSVFITIDAVVAVVWGIFFATLGHGVGVLLAALLAGPRHWIILATVAVVVAIVIIHTGWRWWTRDRPLP